MAEPGNVGKLNIEIGANTVPIDAALKATEAKAAASGAKIGESLAGGVAAGANRSASTIGRGGFLDNFGNSVKGATAGIRSAVGAVTAVVGVATRLLGIVGLVTSGVYLVSSAFSAVRGNAANSADEAERMKKNMADAEAVGKKLTDQLEDANKQLGELAINPQVVDPVAFSAAQKALADKAYQVRQAEARIKTLELFIKESREPEEKRALRASLSSTKNDLTTFREEMKLLEATFSNLQAGRDRALSRIIEAATKKILALQKEQTNKLLESIAVDSARARQIAEEMQSSQFRGP